MVIAAISIVCSCTTTHRALDPGRHVRIFSPIIPSEPILASGRHLTFEPGSGRIGSKVRVAGPDCRSDVTEKDSILWATVYREHPHRVFGSFWIGRIPSEPFEVSVKIPPVADQISGMGGGRIRVGDTIEFSSAPPICQSDLFRVTG